MKQTVFNHLALVTSHPEATLALYQQGLGLKLWHEWGRENKDYIMDLGDDSYVEIMVEKHDAPMPKSCWGRLNLRTSNVRESLARALDAGATLLEEVRYFDKEAARPYPGAYFAAAVKGVEGEEIGFIQELEAVETVCRVHSVTLSVTDIARSVKTYQEAFGLFAGAVEEHGRGCLIDLRGGVYLHLLQEKFVAPMPRGVWAHIAFKDEHIHERFAWAASHGMRGNVPPMFCDVTEALPAPVLFEAAGTSGPDGEDVTLVRDLLI